MTMPAFAEKIQFLLNPGPDDSLEPSPDCHRDLSLSMPARSQCAAGCMGLLPAHPLGRYDEKRTRLAVLPCVAREFYCGSIHKLRKCSHAGGVQDVSGITASVMVFITSEKDPADRDINPKDARIDVYYYYRCSVSLSNKRSLSLSLIPRELGGID